MKRKWDVIGDQNHKKCIDEIIARVEEQEGSQFGVIAAEDIIQIVLQSFGPGIFNLALRDSTKLIQNKLSDLQVEIDLLKNEG